MLGTLSGRPICRVQMRASLGDYVDVLQPKRPRVTPHNGTINIGNGRGLFRNRLKYKMKRRLWVLQHLVQHPYFEANAPTRSRRGRTERESIFASARQRSVTKKQRSARVLRRVLRVCLPIFIRT